MLILYDDIPVVKMRYRRFLEVSVCSEIFLYIKNRYCFGELIEV